MLVLLFKLPCSKIGYYKSAWIDLYLITMNYRWLQLTGLHNMPNHYPSLSQWLDAKDMYEIEKVLCSELETNVVHQTFYQFSNQTFKVGWSLNLNKFGYSVFQQNQF